MFRWEPPDVAQTHESAAGTRRTINPALRNMWPGCFHTHINLQGPLQPASGCCSSSTPSPVLQSLGFPLSTAMGPCSRGSLRLYVSVYLLGDDFKRALVGQAHPGWGTLVIPWFFCQAPSWGEHLLYWVRCLNDCWSLVQTLLFFVL